MRAEGARMKLVIASLCLGAAAVGCGAAPLETVYAADGFRHYAYPYRVSYERPQTRAVMSDDWRIDNIVAGPNGDLIAKDGDDYVTTIGFDNEADGHVDAEADLYLYDLR